MLHQKQTRIGETIVSDMLWLGLKISVLGMTFLFLAMGLLMGVMVLLERLSRGRPDSQAVGATESMASVSVSGAEDEEIVAAIAVALSYWHAQGAGQLGSTLEAEHGPWWTMSKVQQRLRHTLRASRWRKK